MVVIGILLVLALAAGALYKFIGATRAARTYAPPGLLVNVDGQRLHVVCAGNGRPTVMFESGIAASSLSWTSVLRDVAAFTRACAYDRAGLGWSGPAQGPRTVARMLRELRGVLTTAAADGPYVMSEVTDPTFQMAAPPSDCAFLSFDRTTVRQARLVGITEIRGFLHPGFIE
jgi:hypothetical protein